MSPSTILRLTTRQYIRPRISQFLKPALHTRAFIRTTRNFLPTKGREDKDSINTEATEYSKSGSDDASAKQDEAAFDPSITDPEKEKKIAGQGQEGNALDVSPANPEVSKPRGEQEAGAQNAGENKASGKGNPKKA